MRRFCKAALLSVMVIVLLAAPVLALTYQAPFTIIEDAGVDYDMFPALVGAKNTFMAANGFMEADALDTRVETLAGSDKPHMVADTFTLGAVPVEANSQINLFFTTGETDLLSMNILSGFEGFITIPDAAALEPGDDFEFEFQDTYLNTASGTDKNLVFKSEAFSIRISATGSITVGILADSTFSPDAHVEATSVDGDVQRAASESWDAIQSGVGTSAADAVATMRSGWTTDVGADNWGFLVRSFLLFDTSVLPNGATVTSATLRVFGTAKLDDRPWGDLTWNVYSSNPATDTALIAADYDKVGTTPFATAITFSGYDAAGFNTFTLNAAGRAAVDTTDISKFSIREATYDAPDVTPAWSSGDAARITFQTAEGANPPELIVEYEIVEVTAINQASGEHDVKVTADTVNLEISIDGAVAGDGFDSAALGAVSVADNANDWLIMDNSTTPFLPYSASYQQSVGGVLIAWYQPIAIVENTGEAGTADAGTINTLDDAILTQAAEFWVGARLIIITTTDTFAPQGETSAVTAFDAGNDRLTFDALTAAVDAGDTYTIDFGTLVDRQGGDEDARITWGVNPTGISVTLGSMVAESQPIIGETVEAPARDILPPITVSDWFGDGTVSGSTLTNPIRPLITAMSDNTTLTEIQVWRLMGVIAILFATVATAFTIRQHQGITAIVAGTMLGGLVAFDSNIFPMWTLVIAVGLFIAGVVAERSPSL